MRVFRDTVKQSICLNRLQRKKSWSLIRKEKRIELSFENCRYFDVRRWGLVNEYFNKAIHGMNVNYDGNEFFKRTEIVKRIF